MKNKKNSILIHFIYKLYLDRITPEIQNQSLNVTYLFKKNCIITTNTIEISLEISSFKPKTEIHS